MRPSSAAIPAFVSSIGAGRTIRRPLDRHTAFTVADNSIPPLETTSSVPLSPPGITPIQEFEPVLNVEAAASFAVIAIVFTLLQLRINAVGNAAQRRSSALEALRRAESLQLSSTDEGADERVTLAKKEYESALTEEMNLRTIIPGVRIVAPNDPKRDEEERAAAKRFLGWEASEFGDDDLDEGNPVAKSTEEDNAGMSNGAKVILFGVGSMLIALLWTLSLDPMQVFTSLDS